MTDRADFYDRFGDPMSAADYATACDDPGYVIIGKTTLGAGPTEREVSTAWFGRDLRTSGTGAPLIFETAVFIGDQRMRLEQYATEQEARNGHARHVAQYRAELAAADTADDDSAHLIMGTGRRRPQTRSRRPQPRANQLATEVLVSPIQVTELDRAVSRLRIYVDVEVPGIGSVYYGELPAVPSIGHTIITQGNPDVIVTGVTWRLDQTKPGQQQAVVTAEVVEDSPAK